MPTNATTFPPLALLACLIAGHLVAQNPAGATPELEVDRKVVALLRGFARSAELAKAPSIARRAHKEILDHYDADDAVARKGLGFKRVGEDWQQATPVERLPADAANTKQLQSVVRSFLKVRERAGALHRELGLALLQDGHVARGRMQLERALELDPNDVASHEALGHEQLDGFYGSPEQLAFVRRMREIDAKARECAAAEIAVAELGDRDLPEELRETGLPLSGAKGPHVTYWVAGPVEQAIECVTWGERGLLFLDWLYGDAARERLLKTRYKYVVKVRSEEERERLLQVPRIRGDETIARQRLKGGSSFMVNGRWCEWTWQYVETDADRAVGQVTQRCGGAWLNDAFAEGLVHTATYLLCGTLHSSYMQLPTTVARSNDAWERSPDVYRERLRDEIDAETDWPLVQIPRERLENFRDPVRAKVFSFVHWLIARHPDQWIPLAVALQQQPLSEEQVKAAFEKELGRDVGEVEAEWREWARRGSSIGKASGLPQ